MLMDDYQSLAVRTARVYEDDRFGTAVLALGLAGEAGEVADYLKKVVGHDHPLDIDLLAKELGDVLWYVAAMCSHHGLSLGDVADSNVVKLMARYPGGFSTDDSVARRDQAVPDPNV